ncbi:MULTISPECIES: hypothetical protein [Fusobacterium]|uniref:hypothetical protein n=1 Tax=Fusobacterium TaxID=848 RepID=UPI00300A899D
MIKIKVSKTLIDEILKLSKTDWEKVKTNIDYLFKKEEANRNRTLYIAENSLKEKPNYYPCYMEIEDIKNKDVSGLLKRHEQKVGGGDEQ